MKKGLLVGLLLVVSVVVLNLQPVKTEKEPLYTVILPYSSFQVQDLYK